MATNDNGETQARLAHIEALLIEVLNELRGKDRKARRKAASHAEAAYTSAVAESRDTNPEIMRAAQRIVQRSRAR
jgi:hypothetical protein